MSHTRGSEMTLEQLRALGNEKFRALNYGAALMHYTQAIDQDPSSFAIYYNRAITLVKMDAMKEAKEDLLRSLEINPEYIPSLCQLAFIYLYEGNTPDSLETYVKVVKLNQELPHQLNRFKAQLKEAVRLAESRCKQQEYPQDFIDSIITPDIRESLDSYPNLPTHMIESGIPPVAFGNVPISHQFENASAVIARASIPIPVTGIRAATTTATNNNNNNNNSNTNDATTDGNTNNNPVNENIANVLNIPGLLNALNTPGVSASVSIGGPQSSEELMNALGNFTNTQLNPEAANANNIGTSSYSGPSTPNVSTSASATTSTTPTIIHAPVSRTTSGLPTDVLQRHREAHQAALNRAAELRRQREQGLGNSTTAQASTENQAAESNVDSIANSNEDTNSSTSTSTNSTATATTGSDFARQFASTIAAQLTNAAVQNASQSGTNATPNSGAIQSLAQNLTSIASGVLGSLSSGNNFVSMVSNGNGNQNSNSDGNNGSSSENPLDADLDMDLD